MNKFFKVLGKIVRRAGWILTYLLEAFIYVFMFSAVLGCMSMVFIPNLFGGLVNQLLIISKEPSMTEFVGYIAMPMLFVVLALFAVSVYGYIKFVKFASKGFVKLRKYMIKEDEKVTEVKVEKVYDNTIDMYLDELPDDDEFDKMNKKGKPYKVFKEEAKKNKNNKKD